MAAPPGRPEGPMAVGACAPRTPGVPPRSPGRCGGAPGRVATRCCPVVRDDEAMGRIARITGESGFIRNGAGGSVASAPATPSGTSDVSVLAAAAGRPIGRSGAIRGVMRTGAADGPTAGTPPSATSSLRPRAGSASGRSSCAFNAVVAPSREPSWDRAVSTAVRESDSEPEVAVRRARPIGATVIGPFWASAFPGAGLVAGAGAALAAVGVSIGVGSGEGSTGLAATRGASLTAGTAAAGGAVPAAFGRPPAFRADLSLSASEAATSLSARSAATLAARSFSRASRSPSSSSDP